MKLSELVTKEKSYSLSRDVETEKETETRYIHYGDIHTGIADKITNKNQLPFIKEDSYEPLLKGDLILADASEDYQGIATPAIILETTKYRIVAGLHTIVLRPSDKCDSLYLYYLLKTKSFKRHGYRMGTGMKVFGITANNVLAFKTLLPSKKEQNKISQLLKIMDRLLTLQQRKLDLLKKLKQGYLQQMFPAKDEVIPQLRFSDFYENWKLQKLGDIAKSFSGGTPSVGNKEYYNGKIPFIRSAEINKKETELFLTENGLANSSAKLVSQGTILYALYGATSGEVGISHINGAINQAILAIMPSDGYSTLFIVQWLRNNKKKITDKYIQGGQGNLSGAIIKDLQIEFPSKKEQKLVGEFFNKLDQNIALQHSKIGQLNKLKQAYLQKLFP